MAANFSLNTKWIRYTIMALLTLLVLLGIVKACYSSQGNARSRYRLIARNIDWSEHQFTGKEHNLQAFAEELILMASKEANLRVEFVPANPHTLLEDLRANKYDAVFTFMIPDRLNEETYSFSDPLYRLGYVLVVNLDSDIDALADMEDKIVGILEEDSATLSALERYPSIIIFSYPSVNAVLNALADKKIDGVILDNWNAQINTRGFFAHNLKIATPPFTHEGLRLVTLEDPDLEDFMESINDGIERVKANGHYQKLLQKWDLYE